MKLELKDLCVKYDETMVIKKVDMTVESGSFFTIIGDSGSGKSTILKAIAGLVEVCEGDVMLGDASIKNVIVENRDIGFVFQKPLLFPHLSVERNIAFA